MLYNRISIIGCNALADNIVAQYGRMGCHIEQGDALPVDIGSFDEFVLLTSESQEPDTVDDNKAIGLLLALAELLPVGRRRPVVHLLLQSPVSLRMLQMMDLPQKVNECMEVCPFTMADIWAKNILVRMPGLNGNDYPPLDRISIDADSNQTVHLVVAGFDVQAEAVAIHAALVEHFPNYRSKDEHPLRTRITVVDRNLTERRDCFIARYQNLFDNSFYRFVDVKKRTILTHKPMYHGRRMDFVDVEWEFVEGSMSDTVVREHLVSWSLNGSQQLSIVISHSNDEQNLVESTSLPQAVYDRNITVYVRQSNRVMANLLKQNGVYNAIYPFGMTDCGYDVSQPLWRLARLLNYFYTCSYGDKGVPTELPADEVDKAWAEVMSMKMRFSNFYNVMTIATKMHSLGHNPEDLDTFYALTQNEIEKLSATEHNRWSVERLITGSRPCTDREREEIIKDISRKRWYKQQKDVHFDLCAFEELMTDETGKNVQTYDYDLTACIPLMAKTYFDQN